MNTEKTVDALNSLVEINNDRIAGYQTASDETEDAHLKMLFADLSSTSNRCKAELAQEVTRLGGTPAQGTRTTGKFYRVWMDVKATFTGKDTKAILGSCEFGEDAALEAYDDVLNDKEALGNADLIRLVESQRTALKAGHDKVKRMRDTL